MSFSTTKYVFLFVFLTRMELIKPEYLLIKIKIVKKKNCYVRWVMEKGDLRNELFSLKPMFPK